MKKTNKPKKEPQPSPVKRKGLVELTEHDLEQVQGGCGTGMSKGVPL